MRKYAWLFKDFGKQHLDVVCGLRFSGLIFLYVYRYNILEAMRYWDIILPRFLTNIYSVCNKCGLKSKYIFIFLCVIILTVFFFFSETLFNVIKYKPGFSAVAGQGCCSWKRRLLITRSLYGWKVLSRCVLNQDFVNICRSPCAAIMWLSCNKIKLSICKVLVQRKTSRGGRKSLPAGLSVVCVFQLIWSRSTNMLWQERN